MQAMKLARLFLIVITIAALVTATMLLLVPPRPADAIAVEPIAPLPPANTQEAPRLAIAERNPFRVHRTPAGVRYDPARGPAAPTAPAPQRPSLSLAGLILGDVPMALIDGLPGTEGTRAMSLNETVAGFTLRSIAADHAVIRGPDTTYTLTTHPRVP